MKFKEIDKFGINIVLINVILILFMLTTKIDEKIVLIIVASVSNIAAIIFNVLVLKKSNKKTINIITLIVNILILIGLIIYGLVVYKVI